MQNIMPSDITDEVLSVLRNARFGKSEAQTPLPLAAYQILEQLPQSLRDKLIAERGLPGKGNGTRDGFSSAQVVGEAAEMLARRGKVAITYHDSTGMLYVVATQIIMPGYEAHARYQFVVDPPKASEATPADLTLATAFEHHDVLRTVAVGEIEAAYAMLQHFAPKSMTQPYYLGAVLRQIVFGQGLQPDLLKTIIEVEQLHMKVSF